MKATTTTMKPPTMSWSYGIVALCLWTCSCLSLVSGYTFTSPELNRHSIAGLWRLTTTVSNYALVRSFSVQYPMKEFTTYPKKPLTNHEVWLWLNEDGSFQQFQQEEEVEERRTAISLKDSNRIKGTWDFRDGKLILATDRPSNRISTSKKISTAVETGIRMLDTILVGRVVATQELGLVDNPVVLEKLQQELLNVTADHNVTAMTATESSSVDTRLSVPKGSVKIGKFVYPKHHPSFFDMPLMRPTAMGSFQLRQVMGTLNTQTDNRNSDKLMEIPKFSCKDFFNKRFLLTSHPIERRLKGRMRWSIKYNQFVEDISKNAKKQWEEEQNRPVNIRVMEVQFFANRTFATVAGLGTSTILRGKYDVIGAEQDQLWMQVWRFGFGRSVSGSVYSEGPGLTQDDAKSYWGQISYEEEEEEEEEENDVRSIINQKNKDKILRDQNPILEISGDVEPKPKRLQVQGSVLFGSGLEPLPIARFIMREATAEDYLYDDDEEEDEDDENDENDSNEGGDVIDWTTAFQ